ncbi:hypothetical protein [Streptomyces cinereoruber]|uniref:hypothetical protein n=1 Tax=Streptomyces cinereoruber TaxID=67260 RepID=UPI0036265A6B
MIPRRLAALAHGGLQPVKETAVRAVVRQAVRDVRTVPPPPPAEPSADPALTTLHTLVDELVTATHAVGKLMLWRMSHVASFASFL